MPLIPPSAKPCHCGSGQPAYAEHDARGIFIGYMCNRCRDERLSHFRPEVLSDPNYEADEAIDPDDPGPWGDLGEFFGD